MKTSKHIASQFEMPFAAEVETLLRPYSFGELCDKREQMRAALVKDIGNAHRFYDLVRGGRLAEEAFAELLVIFSGRARRTRSIRARVKALRSLCLYTAQRERQGAPNAQPAPFSPPPKHPSPEQTALFSESETPNPKSTHP